MRFDDLASNAGERAAEIGRRAERPLFAEMLGKHRRRTLLTTWTTAAVALLVVLGAVLLTTGAGTQPPVAAPATTTSPQGTTITGAPSTTTLVEEPAPIEVGREDCPITTPGDTPFTPVAETPELVPPTELDAAWYGTPELWTWVEQDGLVWGQLPVGADGTLTQKTFWWSADLVIAEEPQPKITVTAELVGQESETFEEGRVTTGGNADQGTFAIVGLDFPHRGCWSITTEYRGASVSYVAWVDGE